MCTVRSGLSMYPRVQILGSKDLAGAIAAHPDGRYILQSHRGSRNPSAMAWSHSYRIGRLTYGGESQTAGKPAPGDMPRQRQPSPR